MVVVYDRCRVLDRCARAPVLDSRRGLAEGTRRRPTGGCGMTMVRKTTAQAMVAYLAAQSVDFGEGETPFFARAWAIFVHGNVARLGEATHAAGARLPTWRAHKEHAQAHTPTA